jgi:hypothetical protein
MPVFRKFATTLAVFGVLTVGSQAAETMIVCRKQGAEPVVLMIDMQGLTVRLDNGSFANRSYSSSDTVASWKKLYSNTPDGGLRGCTYNVQQYVRISQDQIDFGENVQAVSPCGFKFSDGFHQFYRKTDWSIDKRTGYATEEFDSNEVLGDYGRLEDKYDCKAAQQAIPGQ